MKSVWDTGRTRSVRSRFDDPMTRHRARVTIAFALLMSAATIVGLPDSARGQRVDTDSVTIRINYSGLYRDSTAHLRFLSLLARVLPPTREIVASDSSMEELIYRRYNIASGEKSKTSGRYQPRLVESIRNQITTLNGLSPTTRTLAAGMYVFPTIPAQATWNASLQASKSFSPQVLAASALSEEFRASVRDARPALVTVADRAVYSPARILELTVSRGQAASITAALDSLESVASYAALAPFSYRYAIPPQPTPPTGSSFPDPAVLTSIARALTKPVRRHVPIVVLETNWPTDSVARASCAGFAAILDTIRSHWHIAPPAVRECDSLSFVAPPTQERHSQLVLESMAPLQRAAPDAADIIMLPLGSFQGAGPLLTEIIRLENIVEVKVGQLTGAATLDFSAQLKACNYGMGHRTLVIPACAARFDVDDSVLTWARTQAESVVRKLPSDLNSAAQNDEYHSATDILIGVVRLLSWYMLDRKGGALVNVSWTTDLLKGSLSGGPELANVVVVAAVGDYGVVVTEEGSQTDLGRRVAFDKRILGAVQVDTLGKLACGSSVVDTLPSDRLGQTFAVGFDGNVGADCGTSFSAPRIAWLAAAAESLRTGTFEPAKWAGDLMLVFNRARPCRLAPTLRDIAVDPMTLLAAAAGPLRAAQDPAACKSP